MATATGRKKKSVPGLVALSSWVVVLWNGRLISLRFVINSMAINRNVQKGLDFFFSHLFSGFRLSIIVTFPSSLLRNTNNSVDIYSENA